MTRNQAFAAAVAAAAMAIAGCGKREAARGSEASAPADAGSNPWATPAAAAAPAAPRKSPCERLPWADASPLPEASGADYVPASRVRPAHLLVVGDSGTSGSYEALDAESGAVLHAGLLPLDSGASDDLEGLSAVGDDVYAITSSGWMRRWRRVADGWELELADPAYPLGGDDLVCAGRGTNCGKNFEGLCLRDDRPGPGECAGFAASKQDGHLYCLVRTGGKLRLDGARVIPVAAREALTGCAFGDDGSLWAGSNLFGGATVYRIAGWQRPAEAVVTRVADLGRGFPEAIAVGPGGLVYRFSDTGGAPSLQDRFRCAAAP
jgi:hypothetical protein